MGYRIFCFLLLLIACKNSRLSAQNSQSVSYSPDSSIITYLDTNNPLPLVIQNFKNFKLHVGYTQWYRNTQKKYRGATLIASKTIDTLIPILVHEDTSYYFVVIYFNNCECQTTSSIKTVQVLSKPEARIIQNLSPDNHIICENDPNSFLYIDYIAPKGFVPTVQWYLNDNPSTYNGIPITEGTSLKYNPNKEYNKKYFYVILNFASIETKLTSHISGKIIFEDTPKVDLMYKNAKINAGIELPSNQNIVLESKKHSQLNSNYSYKWYKDDELLPFFNEKIGIYVQNHSVIKHIVINDKQCQSANTFHVFTQNHIEDSLDQSILGHNNTPVLIVNTLIDLNDDFNNKTWKIINIDKLPDNEVKIYNQYGKLITWFHNYQNNWNGHFDTYEQSEKEIFYYKIYTEKILVKEGTLYIIKPQIH